MTTAGLTLQPTQSVPTEEQIDQEHVGDEVVGVLLLLYKIKTTGPWNSSEPQVTATSP